MSNEDLTNTALISSLLEDIHLHVGTELFKRHLEKCSRRRLETWQDGDGLDVLHHAILENNFVVVGNLFALGYFKPPHEVTATPWTYVHLASVLGQRTIVSMLLQERPYDNKKVALDWGVFHRAIAPKIDISNVKTSIVPTEEREKAFAFLPLDLAARYGHSTCVKTILDFHMFRSQQARQAGGVGGGGGSRKTSLSKAGHLNMACMLDSPFAVRLLLTDSPDDEDARSALDVSLKMAKPECVDTLLRFGVDAKQCFGGMNLFHVLFAYSKTFEESWFESFVTVTSVLLRHHHDVNACRPSRTFPLYSLLRSTRISNMELSAPYVFAALLLLLQAGADPNFDEEFVEVAVRDREHNTAFGRRPYASALHCLIDAAVNYMEEVSDPQHVTKYVYKCSELLLRHGADPSYVGKYCDVTGGDDDTERRGNALHALCDATPRLGRVDQSLLLLILRHGANPDACVDGQYPLTSYFDAVIRWRGGGGGSRSPQRASSPENSTRRSSQNAASPPPGQSHGQSTTTTTNQSTTDDNETDLAIDVRRMCRMLGFMSRAAQIQCSGALRSKLSYCNTSSMPSSVTSALRKALEEAERHTMSVPSLRRCCSMSIWRACRRHVGNVYKLPAPKPLINIVIDQL